MPPESQPVQSSPSSESSRRGFFIGAIYAVWAFIAAALGLPAAAYLLSTGAPHSDEWTDLGAVADLPPGQPVELVGRRNRTDGWKTVSEKLTAWVVKSPDGNLVAYGPQCTHLGCAHQWDASRKQFVCPCHNSLFAIDGTVMAGPAPRPLDRYDCKLDAGRLFVGALRQRKSA
jgi:menaquinol-cytochrome c reductase iron-sulfur subunit